MHICAPLLPPASSQLIIILPYGSMLHVHEVRTFVGNFFKHIQGRFGKSKASMEKILISGLLTKSIPTHQISRT